MKKELIVKSFSIFLVIIMIMNLVLFVMKQISQSMFWTIIIIIALIAYKVMPKVNKK